MSGISARKRSRDLRPDDCGNADAVGSRVDLDPAVIWVEPQARGLERFPHGFPVPRVKAEVLRYIPGEREAVPGVACKARERQK